MSTFELTGAQREFFATFGFLHLPGLFADEFPRIEDAFEELIRRHGGAGHEGRERLSVAPFLNHSEYLCSLLDDERLHGIARAVCGDDYQYWNSDGNYYVGDTPLALRRDAVQPGGLREAGAVSGPGGCPERRPAGDTGEPSRGRAVCGA